MPRTRMRERELGRLPDVLVGAFIIERIHLFIGDTARHLMVNKIAIASEIKGPDRSSSSEEQTNSGNPGANQT